MHHIDTITKKEAEALGIINSEGLGFVKPQTAFKNITEQLLAEIKKGNLVWRQGWRSGVVVKGKTYGAQNYETQRPYTGGNAFFIAMKNFISGTDYKFFLTPKQILDRGAKIKKDATPFPVFVFIKNVKTEIVERNGESVEVPVEEKGIIWYYVYPIDLVEGLKEIKRKTHKPDTFNEVIVSDAETIISNMPKAPPIKHGGDKAFYAPAPDYVQMPHKKAFKVQQEYYSVLFHELIHSTGSKKRLNRDLSGKFGDKSYASEELIAEIGAAFLCGVCEIDYYTINNSAAYLKGWSKTVAKEIEEDPNFLKRTVFKAVRAANFIIGKTLEKHGVVKKDVATAPVEKHYAGKEITPNKKVKASVGKAIEDLMNTNKELKKLGAMALGMLFSSYKNNNFPDTNEGLKGKLFEKMEQQGIVEYMTRYELTEYGLEIVKKIEARVETLKAKKSGTDLFPELAGTKYDFRTNDHIEQIILEAKEAIKNNTVFALYENYEYHNYHTENILVMAFALQKTRDIERAKALIADNFKHGYATVEAQYEFNELNKALYPVFKSKFAGGKALQGVTDAVLIFVNAFLSTHNKTVTREELLFILTAFQTAIKSGVIKAKHPLATIANQTQDKLVKVLNTLKPKQKIKLQISNKKQIEDKIESLHGLGFFNVIAATVVGEIAKHVTHKHLSKKEQIKESVPSLSGVMSVTDAINGKYDLIGLDGDYLKLIGEACKPTSFFIYGSGGSGKSSFTLLFSNYMAKKGNKMLYVAGEQFATPVFSRMLQRLKIEDSPNFVIVKSIETIPLKGFDFIVIDSKDSLNFELNDFITLKKNNPNLSFVILSQGTKDGGFTGTEKWRNEVDTLLYCQDLVVYSNMDKNRWGGSTQFPILKIK